MAKRGCQFELVSGVEVPKRRSGGGGSLYPWDKLPVVKVGKNGEMVGQCLRIQGRTAKSFASQAYSSAKRHGIKVTVRDLPDGCVGVWRIA